MAYFCYKCTNELEFIVKVGIKVGRLDTCAHCGANLHCCKNCSLHDPNVHNECLELNADFIRDRESTNFCAQFDFRNRQEAPERDQTTTAAKARLESMFRNLK